MNSNNLGIRMLSPKLRKYLFNRRNKINPDIEKNILSSLVKFDLIDPKKLPQIDHSSSNKVFDELELPKLNGQNINEHINNISYEQAKTYLKLLNYFSNQRLPQIPTSFKFEPGWTKYIKLIKKKNSKQLYLDMIQLLEKLAKLITQMRMR